MKDPPAASKRLDLLRTLYYYSKDGKSTRLFSNVILNICAAKKHSRIIKVLFWALIVPLLQAHTKNN